MRGWVLFRAAAGSLALPLSIAMPAQAQESDPRPALLDLAQRERALGHHREALTAAERAGALKMTSSLRRFIAEEQAALGQIASAYESARRCASEATAEAPSPNHDIVFLGCRELEHGLGPRLGFVLLSYLGAPPPGLSITENGAPVSLDDAPHAFEPSRVAVRAEAPGFAPQTFSVEVGAGEQREVTISLEPRDSGPPRRSAIQNPGPPRRSVRTALDYKPLLVIAVGAASALSAASLHIASNSEYRALQQRCETEGCSPHSPAQQKIERLDRWTNITLFGGIGLMALGGSWLGLTLTGQERTTSAHLSVHPGGVDVSGGF